MKSFFLFGGTLSPFSECGQPASPHSLLSFQGHRIRTRQSPPDRLRVLHPIPCLLLGTEVASCPGVETPFPEGISASSTGKPSIHAIITNVQRKSNRNNKSPQESKRRLALRRNGFHASHPPEVDPARGRFPGNGPPARVLSTPAVRFKEAASCLPALRTGPRLRTLLPCLRTPRVIHPRVFYPKPYFLSIDFFR